jgi:ribosomal protein L40E
MPVEFIQRSWLTIFIVCAALFYFFAYAGWRVQQDARKRGLGLAAVTFWSVSVVFFGIIFLPLYLVFRSRSVFATKPDDVQIQGRFKLCPHCGQQNQPDSKICRKCHRIIDSPEVAMGKKTCPECGAENPVEARRCKVCDQVIGYIDDDDE